MKWWYCKFALCIIGNDSFCLFSTVFVSASAIWFIPETLNLNWNFRLLTKLVFIHLFGIRLMEIENINFRISDYVFPVCFFPHNFLVFLLFSWNHMFFEWSQTFRSLTLYKIPFRPILMLIPKWKTNCSINGFLFAGKNSQSKLKNCDKKCTDCS